MTKSTIIYEILRLRDQLKKFPPFKGRAAIIRKFRDREDFLKRFKTESNLEQQLYDETLKDFDIANEMTQEKDG